MPVCGLVIHLDPRQAEQDAALRELRSLPPLTLGTRLSNRQPAVLEVADHPAVRRWWSRLLAIPGVVHLELAYAGYDMPPSDEDEEAREGPP
jgi:hypothetical protein